MEYAEWMEGVARAFEVIGVAVIALGGLYGFVRAIWGPSDGRSLYTRMRRNFGRPFILGLEILIAADIIETITVDRTLESTAALGILVLVRVVLSFSLEAEIDGVWPWRRAEIEAKAAQGSSRE